MKEHCGLRLIIKNQFAESSVAVSPAPLSGYPADNMLMTWRSRVMRTSGAEGQQITFALPSSKTADAFFCPVDGGVDLRLELFADSAMTARVYDSGITRFGVQIEQQIPWGVFLYGVQPWGETRNVRAGYARALYFDAVEYIAARVTLNHGGENAGYIEVPYLAIGQAFAPEYGASHGITLATRNNRKQQRTRGGSLLRTGAPVQWRELSLSLDYLSESERNRLFSELSETHGEAALVDVYPANQTQLHDHNIFLADIELPEFVHQSGNMHVTKLRLIEV